MAKVEVSEEVAEAIEFLKEDSWSFSSVMYVLTNGGFSTVDKAVKLNTSPIETVAQAYLNGYEIEKMPAGKVAEYYATASEYAESALPTICCTGVARKEAITFVLDAYGIKIEGVNA